MADIIPPGFAEVTLPMANTALARQANIVFGIELVGEYADPDALADAVFDLWVDSFRTQMDNNVTIGPLRVAIGQDGPEPILGFGTDTVAGAASRDSTPPALAVLVRKRTNRPGRRGRGAMYLPWYVNRTAVNEAGGIAGASVTAIQTALNTAMDNLSEGGTAFPMVLLHSDGISAPGDPTPVTSLQVSPVISHQVRRQPSAS